MKGVLPILAVLAIAAVPPATAETWKNVKRIVAVGDVHGDYGQFTAILKQAGLLDDNDDWVGGDTHLVQTGDVPDRGPDTRKILDLLMKIEKQARRAKGYVHCLIGNHEAMNMYGDLRYVIPAEFASFAPDERADERKKALQAHLKQLEKQAKAERRSPPGDAERASWQAAHPVGWFGHRKVFDPAGKYGRWLAGHNLIIRINDVVFLHGGIGPKYADMKISEINSLASAELHDLSRLPGGLLDDSAGPLWYRGLSQGDEATEQTHLDQFLELNKASRMVVGHTVTAGTVIPRIDGKLLMIDVGLGTAYGAHEACLLIEDGEYFAIQRGEKLEIPLSPGDSLVSYLRAAAKLEPQPNPLLQLLRTLESASGLAR